MSNLIRRTDPFQMMRDFFDHGALVPRVSIQRPVFTPAFDVEETSDDFVVRADLPGMEADDIEITAAGGSLVITGEREATSERNHDGYHAYERTFGRFYRTVPLPGAADLDAASADLDNGVLTVTVPKRPEHKPRRIGIAEKVGNKVKGLFGKNDDEPAEA